MQMWLSRKSAWLMLSSRATYAAPHLHRPPHPTSLTAQQVLVIPRELLLGASGLFQRLDAGSSAQCIQSCRVLGFITSYPGKILLQTFLTLSPDYIICHFIGMKDPWSQVTYLCQQAYGTNEAALGLEFENLDFSTSCANCSLIQWTRTESHQHARQCLTAETAEGSQAGSFHLCGTCHSGEARIHSGGPVFQVKKSVMDQHFWKVQAKLLENEIENKDVQKINMSPIFLIRCHKHEITMSKGPNLFSLILSSPLCRQRTAFKVALAWEPHSEYHWFGKWCNPEEVPSPWPKKWCNKITAGSGHCLLSRNPLLPPS